MNPLFRLRILTGSVAVIAAISARSASAVTWNGGGGDDNWGTGANWSGGAAPSTGTGTTIDFAGSTRLTPFFNYSAFDQMGSIFFDSGAGGFTLNGNAIKIFTKIENSSSTLQTVSFSSLVLNGPTATEINPVNGDLRVTSPIFLDTPQLRVFGNNGKTVTFTAVIANGNQTGSFALNQNSNAVFSAANTYTGDTFVNAGKLQFAAGGSANNSAIRIGDSAATAVNAEVDLTPLGGGLTLSSVFNSRSGNAGTATIASQNTSNSNTLSGHLALDKALTITQAAGGALNLTSVHTGADVTNVLGTDIKGNTLTLTPASGGSINYSGTIYNSTGSGSITMNGAGTLTLSGTNTYTGGTNLNGGILALGTGVQALGGSGTVASIGIIKFGGGTLQYSGSNNIDYSSRFSSGAGQAFNIDTNGRDVTLGSQIISTAGGASGTLSKFGVGQLTLSSGVSRYTGATTISGGSLSVGTLANGGSDSSIGRSTSAETSLVFDGGALQYTGATVVTDRAFTINAGKTATVDITIGSTNLTLVGATGAATTGALTKTGSGTLTLSGANTYTGATAINGGTLAVSGSLSATTAVSVTSGTLLLSGNNAVNATTNAASIGATGVLQQNGSNKTDLFGALTLSAGSIIDFGAGNANQLTFNSLASFGGLKVTGWTGLLYAPGLADAGGGTQDRLLFNSSTGLNAAQLASINFFADNGTTQIGFGAAQISFGSQYELVPIPEPTTIFGALALVGLVGYRERRRLGAAKTRVGGWMVRTS